MLHSNNIAYGYKEVYKTQVGGFGQSAACHINILCPLGNAWESERNSVALGLSGDGTGTFSGSLIMNTCNNNRPFFLTANHVYNLATPTQNVSGWRFTFQAWSATCTPSQNSDGVTYNGSTLRANWAGTDFCLVELNTIPTVNSGLHYAGWNRNVNGINQTTIIHHPRGDVMKITRDNDAPVFNTFLNASCWQLVVDNGTTEGGSSGSPYFDQNHRIIAQHYGINDANLPVCQQVNKFGGRFDLSWTGGGTNATRLSNWLDPSSSNVITTNTTNISNLFGSLTINGNDNLCAVPNTYTIPNLPAGATVAWSTTPSNLTTPSTGTGTTFTISRVGTLNGNVTLTANVSTAACGLVQSINKTIKVGIALSDLNVRYSRNSGNSQVVDFGGLNNKTIFTQTGNFAVTASTPLAGGNTFNWVVMGPPPGSGYGWSNFTKSGPNCSFTLTGTNAPTIPLQVTLTNTQNGCTASIDKAVVFVASIPGGTPFNIVVSPNPATDAIKIQELDASTGLQKTTSTITAIELTDKMGNTVYTKNFNSKLAPSSISIPVAQFKNDVYTIRIFNGTEWEVQQIIIQH